MSLLSRLFAKDDPTAGWPAPSAPPRLDREAPAAGPVRLGDALESARPLGRPQKVRRPSARDMILDYGSWQLEFRDGRLACAAFDIEGAERVKVGDVTLSHATTPLDAQVWFGDPSSDSRSDDGLRWMDYERPGSTLALEFEAERLSCVQLYAEGYA